MSVETLIECSCETTGEGPHWDPTTDTLLYVDIVNGGIHRWNSATGQDEKYNFDKPVSFIIPCRKGGYMIGLGQTISHFDWDTKTLTTLHTVDEGKDTRFNDGKCDPSGRLWCGTMGNEEKPAQPTLEQGTLYSLEVDGSIRAHKEKISISNGLAWSDDCKTMYYIDSIPRKVWAYDFDIKAGTISNERTVVDFGDASTLSVYGYPDGMTIDTEGKLWVACYIVGKVIRFDPDTGKALSTIDFPAKRTTSCCFGGKTFDELYVTCGRFGMTDEEKVNTPLAGSVFRVTGLGVKGTPAAIYEG